MSERRNKIAESVLSKLRAKLAEETEELDEGLETQTIKHPVGQRPKGIGWTLKQAGEQTGKDHSVWQRKVKKTVANEEVEDLDEVSKSTLGSYIKKATNQVFSKGVAGGMGLASSNKEDEASGHRQVNKAAKRMLGINTAASKLSGHGYTKVPANEEAEDLDESAVFAKRVHNVAKHYGFTNAGTGKSKSTVSHPNGESISHYNGGKLWGHTGKNGETIGSGSSMDDSLSKHLEKRGYKLNEEVEDLDELYKTTLKSYIKKAGRQAANADDSAEHLRGLGDKWKEKMPKNNAYAAADKHAAKSEKRLKGIRKAVGKLDRGEYEPGNSKLAREEVEQIDELSTKTLKNYRAIASGQLRDLASFEPSFGRNQDQPKERINRRDKRLRGVNMAKKKLANEEVEELDELSRKTLGSYAQKAKTQLSRSEYLAGSKMGQRMHGAKPDAQERKLNQRANKRYAGLETAINKLAKEENECCATDTSLSDVKPSAKGEVYSKTKEKSTAATKPTGTATGVTAGKTGEAYNSTGLTKRIPAVESAVAEVMAKSLERRRIYNESANIAIISPEQRQDWMNVERGMMDVVSYFNKYRAGEE